jgi:hypothetical protein
MNTKKHFKFPAAKSKFLSLSLHTASCQTSSVQQTVVFVILQGKISDYSGVISHYKMW